MLSYEKIEIENKVLKREHENLIEKYREIVLENSARARMIDMLVGEKERLKAELLEYKLRGEDLNE